MPRTTLMVFLSSTAEDFAAYRDVLIAAIDATDFFKCDAMERFGPQDAAAIALCQKKVTTTDLFVSLVGMRRGWEPDGDNKQRSITEMEYDWACESGRKRYVCLTPEDFKMSGRNTDAEHERQLAFRKRVGGERVAGVRNFGSPEKLALEIVTRLLSDLVAGDVIERAAPSLSAAEAAEAKPQVAAAFEKLAEDEDVDLLALARNPAGIDITDLEARLKARAEQHEEAGKAAAEAENKKAAGYWRHLGALAFLNETQKALDAYRKATALDPDDAIAWNQQGTLQWRVGMNEEAEQCYYRALWLARQKNDKLLEAMAVGNLGIALQAQSKLDDARQMFTQCLVLSRELQHKEFVANQHGNIASIDYLLGDLQQAEAGHNSALALHVELRNPLGEANCLGNLALVYAERGHLGVATAHIRRAIHIFQRLRNREGVANCHANLGLIYDCFDQKRKACNHWRKAHELFAEVGMPHMVEKVESQMREAGCGEK